MPVHIRVLVAGSHAAGVAPLGWPSVLVRWQADPAVLAFLALAIGGYLVGVRRVRARAGAWPGTRVAALLGGIGVTGLATLGPLGVYDSALFSFDAAEHMLLLLLAPVLLALARPVTLALRASPPGPRRVLLAVLRSPAAAVVANPLVAFALLNAALMVPLYTPLAVAALRHEPVHDAQHLVYLALGCLLFWPLVGLDPVPGRVPFIAREALLILGAGVYVLLGLVLVDGGHLSTLGYYTSMQRGWGPPPLADQDHGGAVITWVGNVLFYLYCGLVLLLWMRHDRGRTQRADREHDRLVAAGREDDTELARYNAWLTSLNPPERRQP